MFTRGALQWFGVLVVSLAVAWLFGLSLPVHESDQEGVIDLGAIMRTTFVCPDLREVSSREACGPVQQAQGSVAQVVQPQPQQVAAPQAQPSGTCPAGSAPTGNGGCVISGGGTTMVSFQLQTGYCVDFDPRPGSFTTLSGPAVTRYGDEVGALAKGVRMTGPGTITSMNQITMYPIPGC